MTQIEVSKLVVHTVLEPGPEIQLSKLAVHTVLRPRPEIQLSKLVAHAVVELVASPPSVSQPVVIVNP